MPSPYGVLAVGPAVATTRVGDVNAGPWGCWRQVRQRSPLKLKMTMAGSLGGAVGRSGSGHHQSWRY
jgi:hypothetical protein